MYKFFLILLTLFLIQCSRTQNSWEIGRTHEVYALPTQDHGGVYELDGNYYIKAYTRQYHKKNLSDSTYRNPPPVEYSKDLDTAEKNILLRITQPPKEAFTKSGVRIQHLSPKNIVDEKDFPYSKAKYKGRLIMEQNGYYENLEYMHFTGETKKSVISYVPSILFIPFVLPLDAVSGLFINMADAIRDVDHVPKTDLRTYKNNSSSEKNTLSYTSSPTFQYLNSSDLSPYYLDRECFFNEEETEYERGQRENRKEEYHRRKYYGKEAYYHGSHSHKKKPRPPHNNDRLFGSSSSGHGSSGHSSDSNSSDSSSNDSSHKNNGWDPEELERAKAAIRK